MKLAKKLTNPAALNHDVCNGSVFLFSTRPRDRCLPLRRPGDQVFTKVDVVAWRRTTCVRAAGPVRVRIRRERRRERAGEVHPKVKSALDVTKNPLHQVEMRIPRSMHVQACLLNRMSNVRASMCQILQGTSVTAILSRIGEECTISGRNLAPYINRSGAWVALGHTSALKELNCILALRKNHTKGRPGDRNVGEVGEGPKVRHGKLWVQLRDEVLKKPIIRGSEDEVVYI
jgi:hypothetical protein